MKHRKHYTLEAPAPSGYRALHIVVERDGRLIEIQLRAPSQHEWAEAIERTDKGLGMRWIVLVGADSIDTIKRTHGQYFEDGDQAHASPYLAGV